MVVLFLLRFARSTFHPSLERFAHAISAQAVCPSVVAVEGEKRVHLTAGAYRARLPSWSIPRAGGAGAPDRGSLRKENQQRAQHCEALEKKLRLVKKL